MAQFSTAITQSQVEKCTTLAEYRRHKALFAQFCNEHGPHHFKNNEKTGKNMVPMFDSNKVNVSQIPFTFLKLIDKVSPEDPSQFPIPKHIRSKYAILKNRPEFGGIGPHDPHWKTAKTNPKASMSAYHQFIGVRDPHWSLFNVLTFGEDPDFQSPEAVLEMLNNFEIIAQKWAATNGVKELGCYFHIYPFNSVQSLHMHMVDIHHSRLGAAWMECQESNLPLSDVKTYFENLLAI